MESKIASEAAEAVLPDERRTAAPWRDSPFKIERERVYNSVREIMVQLFFSQRINEFSKFAEVLRRGSFGHGKHDVEDVFQSGGQP